MSVVTVTSSAALSNAINAAHAGDTIELAAGEYVLDKLQNLTFSSAITITSADPSHEAVIDGIVLQNDTGLTFKNLEVKVDPVQQVGVIVGGGGNVTLDGLNIHGTGTTDGLGVRVLDTSNVALTNLDVHDVSGGMAIVRSDTVSVLNSKFHDIEVDGIESAGSSHVTISGNNFTNFFPLPGDHSDAIQFFTFGTTTPSHDLTITNNTYVRGAGEAAQGIFMNNEASIPYENVTISGNAIVGGVFQGIAIALVDHLNLTNNIVEGYTDQNSWILIDRSTASSETNNRSTSFNNTTSGNADLVTSGNTTIAAGAVGDTSILGAHDVPTPPAVLPPASLPPVSLPPVSAPVVPPSFASFFPGLTFTSTATSSPGVASPGLTSTATSSPGLTSTASTPPIAVVSTSAAQPVEMTAHEVSYTLATISAPAGSGPVILDPLSNVWSNSMTGGAGADTINTGRGADSLTGGAGADHFVIAHAPGGVDDITDFTHGQDLLDVRGALGEVGYRGTDPFADHVLLLQSDNAGGTNVLMDPDGSGPMGSGVFLHLDHVAPTSLTASDFIFH
jgi:hypothetical protein